MHRFQRQAWAAGFVVLLAVAACHRRANDAARGADGSNTDATAASGRSSDGQSTNDRELAKLNGYVKGYNTLLGTFGLREQFQQYLGQNIPNKTANDGVSVNVGWIGNGLDELKEARALPGGPAALNAAADPLIRSTDALVRRLKGLNVYYESRGPLQDGFARGKREDPLVVAEFKASLAAMDPLSQAVDREQDRRDQAELDAMKSHGDLVGYDEGLSLFKAKALLRLFPDPASLQDNARYAEGDRLAAQLQSALDDRRARREKPHETHDAERGVRDSMEDSAADRLEGMIGSYRELKQSRTPAARQMMGVAYNAAIDEHNRGQL